MNLIFSLRWAVNENYYCYAFIYICVCVWNVNANNTNRVMVSCANAMDSSPIWIISQCIHLFSVLIWLLFTNAISSARCAGSIHSIPFVIIIIIQIDRCVDKTQTVFYPSSIDVKEIHADEEEAKKILLLFASRALHMQTLLFDLQSMIMSRPKIRLGNEHRINFATQNRCRCQFIFISIEIFRSRPRTVTNKIWKKKIYFNLVELCVQNQTFRWVLFDRSERYRWNSLPEKWKRRLTYRNFIQVESKCGAQKHARK